MTTYTPAQAMSYTDGTRTALRAMHHGSSSDQRAGSVRSQGGAVVSVFLGGYRRQRAIRLDCCRAYRAQLKSLPSDSWLHAACAHQLKAAQRDLLGLRHVLKALL